MNSIKKPARFLFLVVALTLISANAVLAQEAVSNAALNTGPVIEAVEKALVEISKSDFNAAQVKLKAARAAAEKMTGNDVSIKHANALVIQGQILSKKGEIKAASDELNKALDLYRSLK